METVVGHSNISNDEIYGWLKDGKSIEESVRYKHPNKTNNELIKMSIGRVWFQNLLPEDYELVDKPVNKKQLDNIIKSLISKYPADETADIISHIQEEAFRLSTILPNSFSVDTFIPPDEWVVKKTEFKKRAKTLSIKEFTDQANALTAELVEFMDSKGFKINNVLNGGIKGDPIDDWKTLLVSKGFVIDIEGKMHGPITDGTAEGYSKTDYYVAGSQARRNYYYKTSMSAKPGYLARKVIMSNANVTIDDSKNDCGTKKYFELFVDKGNANLLLNRYYKEGSELIKIEDPTTVIGKKIKLRSPLYCLSEKGICPICYGDHYKTINTKNIGILAGGAVNMVAINSMMKMRHKSSQVEIIDVDFMNEFKKAKDSIDTLNKYFNIDAKQVSAKKPCTIIIDRSDYDESTLLDIGDKIVIPGLVNIEFSIGDDNKTIATPFNFQINLKKPPKYETRGKLITLHYDEDDLILYQDYYTKQTEPGVIERLFGGSLKYISSPEALVDAVYEQLPNMDLIHSEIIISNMFRDKSDISVPCRLRDYKDFEIVGVKRLPYINSWLTGLAFENPNKAIKDALLNEKDADMNPIERILLERFYDKDKSAKEE